MWTYFLLKFIYMYMYIIFTRMFLCHGSHLGWWTRSFWHDSSSQLLSTLNTKWFWSIRFWKKRYDTQTMTDTKLWQKLTWHLMARWSSWKGQKVVFIPYTFVLYTKFHLWMNGNPTFKNLKNVQAPLYLKKININFTNSSITFVQKMF